MFNFFINPSEVEKKIINFIRRTVFRAGFSKVILGLSGGLDSSVVSSLAVKALNVENVHIGLLPYGDLNKEGLDDAYLMIDKLNIPQANIHQINIKPLVDKLVDLDNKIDNLRKGNVMVRMRMILLYDLAKKINALVLGTSNKTESLLGYFTRFGDEACDLAPLVHLYKTQVRQLAAFLEIPEKILNKQPTAGLWDHQTDEGEFGFTYEKADKILYLYQEQKKTAEEMIKSGFGKETVAKVIERLQNNAYKHKTPYCITS